jgi:vacuolar protein sorting-associated protein VTA1
MDAVDIPSERVPEGLKACEQILKRGKEVKKVEPVVTYWCKLFCSDSL